MRPSKILSPLRWFVDTKVHFTEKQCWECAVLKILQTQTKLVMPQTSIAQSSEMFWSKKSQSSLRTRSFAPLGTFPATSALSTKTTVCWWSEELETLPIIMEGSVFWKCLSKSQMTASKIARKLDNSWTQPCRIQSQSRVRTLIWENSRRTIFLECWSIWGMMRRRSTTSLDGIWLVILGSTVATCRALGGMMTTTKGMLEESGTLPRLKEKCITSKSISSSRFKWFISPVWNNYMTTAISKILAPSSTCQLTTAQIKMTIAEMKFTARVTPRNL